MKQPKDSNGNYYIDYILHNPPSGTDAVVWEVSVTEYLRRSGVTEITGNTTVSNTDFPEVRRLYNRLMGEGKQRRNAESHAAPGTLTTNESED